MKPRHPSGPRRPFDVVERCFDAPIAAATPTPAPCVPDRPNTTARSYGFVDQDLHPLRGSAELPTDPQAQRFQDLLGAAHSRMFPPHLFPPLTSEPYLLRATHRAALVGAGTHRAEVLSWIVPDGLAFTVQEAHLRVVTGFVAAEVGFTVTRGNRQGFAGDELRTRHQDGSESVQPPMLPVNDFETAALLTTPFATTFLTGERVVLTVVCIRPVTLALFVHVQLRGYTYPTEISR